MLILVMGLPGTGKTYFAGALADQLNAVHLSSDAVRADLAAMGQYDAKSKRQVYEELLRRAATALDEQKTVIVDATFQKAVMRRLFAQLASEKKSPLRLILIQADEGVIRNRLRQRRADSEADYSVYLKIKEAFETINQQHFVLWSDELSLKEMIDKALMYLHLEQGNE